MTRAARTVLIVAHPTDVHALSVAKCVESRGGIPILLDTGAFPKDTLLSGRFSSGTPGVCYMRVAENPTRITVSCDNPLAVWWRRTNGHSLGDAEVQANIKKFSFNESRNMLMGTLLGTASVFINDPGASRRASLKPYQLQLASDLGFKVPQTLVTNNPEQAREFLNNSESRFVYKTFTGTHFGFYETRLFEDGDYSELWRLANAPVILQEHVDGEYDVRATIVEDEIFSARLMYKEGRHPVDSRIGRVPVNRETLPTDVVDKLITLREKLGLTYMAVDMRYCSQRGYTFFEVNPEGQFLWIELETALPISDAIAKALLGIQTDTPHNCKPALLG
jgi:glutathione synthase/RimK-type ligase-like ATP-grasp enzyme